MSTRTALITGASSGIGEAFAHVFASRGFDLVLTARRADRLEQVAGAVAARHGQRAQVIVADLSDRDAAARVCAELVQRGIAIDALVNNAGYGVPGAYVSRSWEQQHALMQVMIISLSELTHRLLPGMIERGYGRIVNVASLAALVPAPAGHTVYPAAKAFVVRFSESLAEEVRPHGVNVTAICPGFTRSEFHDRTGTRDQMRGLPAWMWMDAATVARQGYDAVMAGTTICVNGHANRAIATLVKSLPDTLVRAVGRRAATRYRKV
jgi:short-subunit dehydrogenase